MKILLSIALILSFAFVIQAQTNPDKNSIAIVGTYVRQDAHFTTADLTRDAFRDSAGIKGEWAHAPGKTAPVYVGLRFGASFHDGANDSTIAVAQGDLFVRVQPRKGSFRPYAEVTGGAERGDFGGYSFDPQKGLVGARSSFTYGAGGGFDVKIAGNTYARLSANVTRSELLQSWKTNVTLGAGLVWHF
jgi:hypothetical protein